MSNKKVEKQVTNLQMVEIDHNEFAVELMKNNVHVNLTDLAKPFGKAKQPSDWLKTKESREYIEMMSVRLKIGTADLVQVRQGGIPGNQGTWCTDRRIALRFAQWLSPDFSIAVDELLLNMLINKQIPKFGNLKLTPTIERALEKLEKGERLYTLEEFTKKMGYVKMPHKSGIIEQAHEWYYINIKNGNSENNVLVLNINGNEWWHVSHFLRAMGMEYRDVLHFTRLMPEGAIIRVRPLDKGNDLHHYFVNKDYLLKDMLDSGNNVIVRKYYELLSDDSLDDLERLIDKYSAIELIKQLYANKTKVSEKMQQVFDDLFNIIDASSKKKEL